MKTDFRKWLAAGTGVGIEVLAADLQVTISRVRPRRVAIIGAATVADFRNRPAAEWGNELSAFLKKLGVAHAATTVLLPRSEVIVRQVNMPGVSERDLSSAIQLELDSLHPFTDDPVAYSFARIPNSQNVLVGIARKDVVDRYSTMFAEAGIKVASFTFSAAALYSAIRIYSEPQRDFFVFNEQGGDLEVYGESEARPLLSATLGRAPDRAAHYAASELRLEAGTSPKQPEEILPVPAVFPASYQPGDGDFAKHALSYATSLVAACPWLTISGNLLPPEQRKTNSRLRWAPTVALGTMLAVMVGVLAAQSSYENSRYVETLQVEIRKLEPQARKVEAIDRELQATRERAQMLDEFRRRSKADMDALNEITKLIAPPGWVIGLDLDRTDIQLNGEVEQAAGLLKILDGSPLFANSEFTMPIGPGSTGEQFRVRMTRENSPQ